MTRHAELEAQTTDGRTVTVQIRPITSADIDALPDSRDRSLARIRATYGYALPGPIRVPKPPDYSTPASISARCREAGSTSDAMWEALHKQDTMRAYRALRRISPALPVRVADQHRSRWDVVPSTDAEMAAGHGPWTLRDRATKERISGLPEKETTR